MSNVDLSALHIDDAAVPKRPIGPRLLVFLLLALTITVGATFVVPILWPARAVRMAAVQVATVDAQSARSTASEAVGWVEADPYPVIVRPLVSGHMETLQVLEGAAVKGGETIIATLASAELLAARDRAIAALVEREAQLVRALANQLLASERLAQNSQPLLRMHEASTKLASTTTKLATAQKHAQELAAQAKSARANLVAQERLLEAGHSYPVALERAHADAEAAQAKVSANTAEIAGLQSELDEQSSTLNLCKELAADPVDLRGAAAIATAESDTARAALAKSRTDMDIAKRELEWATVRAPVDGIVLRIEAEPGDMVGHGEKGIVVLYDPKKLRARIDIPIDSLRGITEGQEVEITSDAIGKQVVKGIVQRFQHETDLLKNTLQVKIGLVDPPRLLRPETLCRARFLASKEEGQSNVVTVFRVPAEAVQGNHVFVFDPKSGTARAINIEVLSEDGDASIVRGNLSPTQRVVLDAVGHGEAIREQTL